MSADLRAPFPWFGGKSRCAEVVWRAFGNVDNYVEPFFGSGAVLLSQEANGSRIETVNDKDGLVCNFWRSIRHSPEETAEWADNPVNENDLHARHIWLLDQLADLVPRLEADPDFHDPKVAGWWVWGICCWIGGEFCSGNGPWQAVDGKLVHLGNAGLGVKRRRVQLGNAGQGVNRKLDLYSWFDALSARLQKVRICSGDWARVCGPTPTFKQGLTGVFLDPPYPVEAGRAAAIYRSEDLSVAHEACRWAIEAGRRADMRIAFCGYEGSHDFPAGWECHEWKTHGGYGTGKLGVGDVNKHRERIWFSPACLPVDLQMDLFA